MRRMVGSDEIVVDMVEEAKLDGAIEFNGEEG